MIRALQHVAIGVRSIKAAVEFYAGVFGLSVIHTAHHEGEAPSRISGVLDANLDVCVVGRDGLRIELLQYRDRPVDDVRYPAQNSIGLTHLCFEATDVDEEYARLRALGYEFYSPPLVGRPGGPKVCYFKGPDNVVIELFEPVTRNAALQETTA